MSDKRSWSRRAVLAAGVGGLSVGAVDALTNGGESGTLTGGTMALSQAYNVSGDLWIGPDSSKGNVSADSGRVYMASDTQVEYYGDGGSWVKMGVGSSSEPVPSLTTDEGVINDKATVEGARLHPHPSEPRLATGLNRGLVGWWNFESIDNGYIRDQTDNNNDIELFGSPSTEPGLIGDNALTFDGSDDYGRIPADSALDLSTGDFTIACWMYYDSRQNWQPVVSCWPDSYGGGNLNYGMYLTNVSIYTDTPMALSAEYADSGGTSHYFGTNRMTGHGPWYHLVLTFDSSDNRFTGYVNNTSEGTESLSAAPQTGSEPVQVGARGSTLLTGGIDDLRMWNRKLSREEIAAEYVRGVGNKRRYEGEFQRFVDNSDGAGDTYVNPIGRYDDSKTDPWRVLANNKSTSSVDLWTSSDKDSWSKSSTDVISGYANADDVGFSDYVVDDSGTFWVYGNEGGDTVVFSGSDWTSGSLTYDSVAIAGETDPGAFRTSDGDVYLYVEIDQVGVSAQKLAVYKASSPNGSFSKIGETLDLTNKPWNGGDVDVFERDGVYWMFTDMTNTQEYDQAVARSEDLLNFELVSEGVLRGVGGDIDIFEGPNGELWGASELAGSTTESYGVGFWRVFDRYSAL